MNQLSLLPVKPRNNFKIIYEMKKGIHPENYRLVDGVEYPLVKMEISNSSHPFYTGKIKLIDTAGRVDKFMNRYKNHMENRKK